MASVSATPYSASNPEMANAIRAFAIDVVQAANSGHPAAPMGMADTAVPLWGHHLRHNPAWANRDRFVLPDGQGPTLIFALLHLTGYKLSIDELKNFRKLHSETAGSPEVDMTPGVETITRPLGQGITNAVDTRIAQAKTCTDKPTLVVCKNRIGKGSPNRANTVKAHGEPLGAEEIKLALEALKWPYALFVIPKPAYAAWDAKATDKAAENAWDDHSVAYKKAYPKLAKVLVRRIKGELATDFHQVVLDAVGAVHTKVETVASRKASQLTLEAFTAAVPESLGGSADLTGFSLTNSHATPNFRVDATGAVVQIEADNGGKAAGRHINYCVREFGMAAIMKGMALHGGFIPCCGTFLTFSDYSRNAIRKAALMKQRVTYVFTQAVLAHWSASHRRGDGQYKWLVKVPRAAVAGIDTHGESAPRCSKTLVSRLKKWPRSCACCWTKHTMNTYQTSLVNESAKPNLFLYFNSKESS